MIELKHVVLLLIAGGVGFFFTRRHSANARSLLQAWADANGYRILRARQRSFFMPLGMLLGSSNAQVVYHVKVYDASIQRVRSAWVRLGTYLTGSMDGSAVHVKWVQ